MAWNLEHHAKHTATIYFFVDVVIFEVKVRKDPSSKRVENGWVAPYSLHRADRKVNLPASSTIILQIV